METQSQAFSKSAKVQFSEDTFDVGHDSHIGIRVANDELIDVHLGFLQVRHRYEITFTFECPKCIEGSLVVRNQDSSGPNLNVHVIGLRNVEKTTIPSAHAPTVTPETCHPIKYEISVELFAHKEKLLKEHICLHSSECVSQTLTLGFHARVLGKGKGTPFLRNGIKCIGIEMDEDEDNSDWPGFN